MHEMALSESIVDLVTGCARREGMNRVAAVTVEIGAGAAVDTGALAFCFPIVAEGTVVEGAALRISHVPLRAVCNACGDPYRPEDLASVCPVCRSADRRITDGRQMRVVEVTGA
jgi:hydrogenase nickel incorporation protein HypA/HybF